MKALKVKITQEEFKILKPSIFKFWDRTIVEKRIFREMQEVVANSSCLVPHAITAAVNWGTEYIGVNYNTSLSVAKQIMDAVPNGTVRLETERFGIKRILILEAL
ncbi:hypothetical protein Acj9p063 [Acinetobacter phage Acj9]|uniref:Uncharacterized protein n=1 Tax=Acinetobacter phage Acj9 TaxID=760939 RepID=E5EPJ7_9CAUD|nr:hypothetical protein Acj9p063 [Acinetobacter phage Acj9]ADG59963.1 hypothetical protein Acj9p063 [Acinetobacter phage Acj9]